MDCKQCEKEYRAFLGENKSKFFFQKGIYEIVPSKCDFSDCPLIGYEMATSLGSDQTTKKALERISKQEQRIQKVFEKILK